MGVQCPCCPYVARCQGWLKKHALVHDVAKFACPMCDRLFKTVSNRNLHMREYHAKCRSFKCDLCDFATQHKRALDVHMKLHSDEKPYACPHCLFRAKRSFEIYVHVKAMHDNGRSKRKRREEEVAREFDAMALPYVREHTVTFDRLVEHGAARKRARVDFVFDMPWWLLLEVDEKMHVGIPIQDECARLLAIIAELSRASPEKKILIVRYNPDAYAQNGQVVKPTPEQRRDVIQRALRYEPEAQITVVYLFYRQSSGELPDVVREAAYDTRLRQYVVPAETALYGHNL